MSEIKGNGGELRGTLHIKRKATGKVDTVEFVARTTPEQHAQIVHGAAGAIVGPGSGVNNQPKENDDGGDALDSK
jgi:hypothetical protein